MARRNVVVIGALVLLIAGCTSGRGIGDLGIGADLPLGDVSPTACAGCHGTQSPWNPPPDSSGHDDPAYRGVGAHSIHLAGGIGAAVACDTCHVVPARVDSTGHIDTQLPAEVAFAGRSILDALQASSEAASRDEKAIVTCRNVYCHGASLKGGTATEPQWNAADAAKYGKCGACHGLPPATTRKGAAHPASDNCSSCHGEVVAEDGTIKDPTKHADGVVQVTGGGDCNSCHGSADNPAPPVDPLGRSDTTLVTVGAHQAHLKATAAHPVACSACHDVPASIDAPGHNDGKGDVAFKGLSVNDGATPAWDPGAATCAGSYCHGTTLTGGTKTTPKWTVVDGTQAACGTCHGAPPPAPHPAGTDCSTCHGDVINSDGSFKDATRHVDGTVDLSGNLACNTCHGNVDNAAPPVDTTGSSDTTRVTVGAHQSHLKVPAGIFAAVPCGTCHKVPSSVGDAGHNDGTAQVNFTGRAVTDGANPAWDAGAATCADAYCHGGTLSGGTLTTPKWTKVDGTQAVCGNCHGSPPPAPHPQVADCSKCHGDVINADRTFKNPSLHVNGQVDVITGSNCNVCHGNADNAAPPMDLDGSSDTTKVTVGAHQSHLKVPAGIFAPVSCTSCHTVPGSTTDPTHIDGVIEVAFHGNALAAGAVPSWDEGTAKCSGTYCHGATIGGGTLTTPKWTQVDGTQVACGTCHSVPPPAPHPATDLDCMVCHAATMGPNETVAHPENHVNGQVDVADITKCNTCHGNADNPAPPKDLTGSSDPTRVTVGAHQGHLKALAGLSSAVTCATCHKVPASFNAAGHVDTPSPTEVTFSGLAGADGAAPAWDRGTAKCANTYCHGATLNAGGAVTAPVWTVTDASQIACASCHGFPPPSPHPAQTNCSACHADTVDSNNAIGHPDKHINGTVDVQMITACNGCHGGVAGNAPPVDTHGGSATSLVTVGAHQSHLGATLGKPVACAECHVVPGNVSDPTHIDAVANAELTFGALSKTDGADPSWNRGTAVCSDAYCHGATLTGGTNRAPVWTTVNGSQKACGTCHGNPPPAPHVQSPLCGTCHAPTAAVDGSITDATHHIDGTLDVRTAFACNSCHGSADNNAPPVDASGQSATTRVSVGAHQAHLKGTSNLAVALVCTDCHTVPAALDSVGHIDSAQPAELTFGATSKLKGASPSWNHATAKCSGTYCHGATMPVGGATNRTPTWSVVDNSQDACGTCHGVSPTTGQHPSVQGDHAGFRCTVCHGTTTTNSNVPAISDKTRHINGTVEMQVTSLNWNATNRSCDPSCHGSEDW
jgi:predicted CxxxxCH...CXXCH cytochrome family protein